jgi:Domain of unknown function (DUF4386)
MKIAPKAQARLTGALYLVIMVAALFSELAVRSTLIVSANASVTASNILGAETLFRFSGALDIFTYVADVAIAGLLYELTRPAGQYLASVAAFFRLAYSAMAGVLCFYSFSALDILHGQGLEAFTRPEQQAMALSQLHLRSTGFVVALVFFGVHLLLIGLLIIRSRYFPAWIGLLIVLAGSGYIINSFMALLLPNLDLGPWLLLPGLVGEGALTLWLLIIGVKETECTPPPSTTVISY